MLHIDNVNNDILLRIAGFYLRFYLIYTYE